MNNLDKIKLNAPCLFGLEGILADEIKRLHFENVTAQDGRVSFNGTVNDIARANIWLRCAERIGIVIGEFEAHSFEELFEGTKKLPWEMWIGKKDAFPVGGHSVRSKLFSIPDCQAIIKKAVVERLKTAYKLSWFEETGTEHKIRFNIINDTVTVMIDTSGEGLHKRGYRANANEAPLRETLAAALVYISRYRRDEVFCDPLCGSGTIAIEAAQIGKNAAPGLYRRFVAQDFDQIPKSIWEEEREAAKAKMFSDKLTIYASDIDPTSVKLTQENAAKAGVGPDIIVSQGDVRDLSFKENRGVIICNPPYGERMSDKKEVEKLYREMGRKFQSLEGFRYYIISSVENFEELFGKKSDKNRKLYNGMLKCFLYQYFKR